MAADVLCRSRRDREHIARHNKSAAINLDLEFEVKAENAV